MDLSGDVDSNGKGQPHTFLSLLPFFPRSPLQPPDQETDDNGNDGKDSHAVKSKKLRQPLSSRTVLPIMSKKAKYYFDLMDALEASARTSQARRERAFNGLRRLSIEADTCNPGTDTGSGFVSASTTDEMVQSDNALNPSTTAESGRHQTATGDTFSVTHPQSVERSSGPTVKKRQQNDPTRANVNQNPSTNTNGGVQAVIDLCGDSSSDDEIADGGKLADDDVEAPEQITDGRDRTKRRRIYIDDNKRLHKCRNNKPQQGNESRHQSSNKLIEEVFDTHAPLGAYFVTETVDSEDCANENPTTLCKVFSIWEKGQMNRHFKVRQGSVINSISFEGYRKPVQSHLQLREHFLKAQKTRSNLKIVFVDFPVSEEAKNWQESDVGNFEGHWSAWGEWQGPSSEGWDGVGAQSRRRDSGISLGVVPDVLADMDEEDDMRKGTNVCKQDKWKSIMVDKPLVRSPKSEKPKRRASSVPSSRRPAQLDDESSVAPSVISEWESTENRGTDVIREKLARAVHNGKCKDLVCVLQHSQPDLSALKAIWEEAKQTLHHDQRKLHSNPSDVVLQDQVADFVGKCELLKIFASSYYVIEKAFTLLDWVSLEISLKSITLNNTSQHNEKPQMWSVEVFVQFVGHDKRQDLGKLRPTPINNGCLLFPDSVALFRTNNNRKIAEEKRELVLRILSVSEDSQADKKLGCYVIPLNAIDDQCATNNTPATVTHASEASGMLPSCQIELEAKRGKLPSGYTTSKRKDTSERLRKQIEQIQKFNNKFGDRSFHVHRNIRAEDRVSFLHAAVQLYDADLVGALLCEGADPDSESKLGTPNKLATSLLQKCQKKMKNFVDSTSPEARKAQQVCNIYGKIRDLFRAHRQNPHAARQSPPVIEREATESPKARVGRAASDGSWGSQGKASKGISKRQQNGDATGSDTGRPGVRETQNRGKSVAYYSRAVRDLYVDSRVGKEGDKSCGAAASAQGKSGKGGQKTQRAPPPYSTRVHRPDISNKLNWSSDASSALGGRDGRRSSTTSQASSSSSSSSSSSKVCTRNERADGDELRCFRTNWTSKEHVLGLGVDFTVNPVKGRTDYISVSQDVVSYATFQEGNTRTDSFGNKMTLFLPLYISRDHLHRALPIIKKTLVALCPERKTHTFHPFMVLDVFPNIITTVGLLACDKGVSMSKRAFEAMTRIRSLFLALAVEYPTIRDEALRRLRLFVRSESDRHKKLVPNLGHIIPLLLVVNRKDFAWPRLRAAYLSESFDRNVLWLCKKHPELAMTDRNETAEQVERRITLSFGGMLKSLRLTMFFVYFLKTSYHGSILEQEQDSECVTTMPRAPRDAQRVKQEEREAFDEFRQHPTPPTVSRWEKLVVVAGEDDCVGDVEWEHSSSALLSCDHFEENIKQICSCGLWRDYFKFLGLQCPRTKAMMADLLQLHVDSSLRRGYHKAGMDFSRVHANGTSRIISKGW